MASNAINAFGIVLDNSSKLEKEIRAKIIKLLGINSKDKHLTEYIQERVSHFNVSNIEHNYIENIKKVIDKELSKIQQQKKENSIIDYSLISQNLTNRLRQLQNQDINLDDDLKDLATQIPNKFPLCGITPEQFLNHFNSKKETIAQTITTYNDSVIGTLIKLAPQLVQELKMGDISINIQQKQSEQEIQNTIQAQAIKEENISHSNVNLHEIIKKVRKQLYEKRSLYISNINSINPFKEVKPLKINDFQQELTKYNVSVDSSYIEGIVSQINLELSRQLLNKAKENILESIISTPNDIIKLLTTEDLLQKYGINLDNNYMNEIIDFVNNGITLENQKRNNSIQSQHVRTNGNVLPPKEVVNKNVVDDLFIKYPRYKRLFECFIELAETDVQKDAIEQIMKKGEYNGFKVNSMLSNEKYSEKAEIERRITFSEIILHDESLFFYLANNGLNVFNGTKIDALQTIFSNGILSSLELSEKNIQLRTGEELEMNKKFGGNIEKRSFISLTDDFDTSASYAGFPYEEQTDYVKKYYGKDLASDKDIPIIFCFNGNDIEQRYSDSLVTIKSSYNEIGINSSINLSDVKCIITSYDKIEYVKSIASKYGIDVLGYNHNDKFKKRLINDKEGKFYSSNMEIDEQEFKRIKEKLKERKSNKNNQNSNNEEHINNQQTTNDDYDQMLEELNNQNNIGENSSINKVQNTEHLPEDLSMTIASNVKMDMVFYLTEKYNSGIPFVPITASDIIAKYNINENVAQRLALEVNRMLESYVHEKEHQMENYTPYILDGFEGKTQGI